MSTFYIHNPYSATSSCTVISNSSILLSYHSNALFASSQPSQPHQGHFMSWREGTQHRGTTADEAEENGSNDANEMMLHTTPPYEASLDQYATSASWQRPVWRADTIQRKEESEEMDPIQPYHTRGEGGESVEVQPYYTSSPTHRPPEYDINSFQAPPHYFSESHQHYLNESPPYTTTSTAPTNGQETNTNALPLPSTIRSRTPTSATTAQHCAPNTATSNITKQVHGQPQQLQAPQAIGYSTSTTKPADLQIASIMNTTPSRDTISSSAVTTPITTTAPLLFSSTNTSSHMRSNKSSHDESSFISDEEPQPNQIILGSNHSTTVQPLTNTAPVRSYFAVVKQQQQAPVLQRHYQAAALFSLPLPRSRASQVVS